MKVVPTIRRSQLNIRVIESEWVSPVSTIPAVDAKMVVPDDPYVID